MKEELQTQAYETISPEIISRMESAVANNFGSDEIYTLTSGSLVYGGGILRQSDIDILVVLSDTVIDKPKDVLMEQIKGFVNEYLLIHKDTKFSPDLAFPGEYVSISQANNALLGRGYHVDDNGHLFLPIASEGYYMESSERWYRAWLSMSAYGHYISGNKNLFLQHKIDAWKTQILFNCFELECPITADGLIDLLSGQKNKWAGSGISTRYLKFREIEKPHVQQGFIELSDEGYFNLEGSLFIPNSKIIQEWHVQTAENIINQNIRQADFITDINDVEKIASYAENMWSEMNNI